LSVNLRLDWCSHAAAKYAVEHWHYSARMPKFKQIYIGAWESGRFIGAIIFGLSVTPPIVGDGATPIPTLHYAHVDEASVRATREANG